MQLTIRNLTGEPITATTTPKEPNKFTVATFRKAEQGQVAIPSGPTVFTLKPQYNLTTTLPKDSRKELILRPLEAAPTSPGWFSRGGPVQANEVHEGFKISLSFSFGKSWQIVPVPEDSPWRVFHSRVTRKHHNLVILIRRNMASFLSQLPDRLPLSSLCLPGTHDTMAFHGWPVSQCQTRPLLQQLLAGIRVIDIRLALVPPPPPTPPPENWVPVPQELIAYHGIVPQQAPFVSILRDMADFLSSPAGQRETIVVSIKQEDGRVTPGPVFSQFVRNTMIAGPGGWDDAVGSNSINKGMWFLENRVPTLGEVRGKCVLFSRFGGNGAGWPHGLNGMGIHPGRWPDSSRDCFEWDIRGTEFRVHDWYNIGTFLSIPDKFQLASANLIPPSNPPKPLVPFTYFSGASFPFALPPFVAKGFGFPFWGWGFEGVNSMLGKWLLDKMGGYVAPGLADAAEPQAADANATAGPSNVTAQDQSQGIGEEPRIRGWTLLDYYDQPGSGDIVPLLVECNFLGRKRGQEGW